MVQSAGAVKIKQVSTSRDVGVQFSSFHAWKPEGAKAAPGLAA